MEAFATLIGQYNSVALSLNDGDFGTIALDSSSRIIQDHSTSSIKIGDGTDILDVLVEDAPYAGGEKAIGMMAVRQDTVGTMVSADGDFTFLQVDDQGRLRVDAEISVLTGSDKEEDTAHSSGDIGCFVLGVANEANSDLCSDDGDYVALATDKKGRLQIDTVIDETGTEEDNGVDEANDGLIDVPQHATNFVDLVTISVGAGETLYIKGCDLSSDHLVHGRLVVFDDTTLTKVIRAFPITENIGYVNFNWLRAIEVAGGATITVKLQARGLRVSKTAHCGGGINAYKL